MLNFGFLEKILEIVFFTTFVDDLSNEMFFMSYSITDQIYHCLIDFTFADVGQYAYLSSNFLKIY